MIGWRDPFNLLWLLRGPPLYSSPSALPASIHNSVLSLFQGEYQLCTGRRGLVQPLSSSAYTFPENHMRAAPLLYKTWHFYHRDSTWSTVTAVRGFNKDQFCFFHFGLFSMISRLFFLSFEIAICFLWCLYFIMTMQVISFDIDLLWASKSSFSPLGSFLHLAWETAAPECHLESPARLTRKKSPWCKRPSERPIRRTFWRQLWGWGWGHRNHQPLSGSHLNYSPIRSSPHWSAEPRWRRATGRPNLRKSTTSRWDSQLK